VCEYYNAVLHDVRHSCIHDVQNFYCANYIETFYYAKVN
jgi:hypothetical protein